MTTNDTRGSLNDSTPATHATDWDTVYSGDVPDTPLDGDLTTIANAIAAGRALDLGCGTGQNSIWLAQRGWTVRGVDVAAKAIHRARQAAKQANVEGTFETADIRTWRPGADYDLVVSTYALPQKGPGRERALEMARNAVAPGGILLLTEFDISMAGSSWMKEDLVTLDEITTAFAGLDIERAEVRAKQHTHGYDTQEMSVVIVVAHRKLEDTAA